MNYAESPNPALSKRNQCATYYTTSWSFVVLKIANHSPTYSRPMQSLGISTDVRGAFQGPTQFSFWNSNSFWYYTRADQNRFIDCPVRVQANRLKNFFPTEWHRQHQIVYVKADLLKVAGRVPGAVAL